jgi:hypothetical protein
MVRAPTAPAAKRRWRAAVLAEAGVDVAPLRTLDAVDAVDATLTALVAVIVVEGSPWFRLGETRGGLRAPPRPPPAGAVPPGLIPSTPQPRYGRRQAVPGGPDGW